MTNGSQSTNSPGRPKDPLKREAILEAAKALFLSKGYEGSSMDGIATEAGVSKLTVYSHFTDKETLFSAAVKSKCEEQLPELLFEPADDIPIETALLAIGDAFFALLNSPATIEFHRVMIANSHLDPKLAMLFFEAGPQRVLQAMERFLTHARQLGKLDLPCPKVAADQFLCLVKGSLHFHVLVGCCYLPPPEDAKRHVQECVALFVRAYGKLGSKGTPTTQTSPATQTNPA
jgi:TetR/AcrR family transcriptional repressor of mexJK operon